GAPPDCDDGVVCTADACDPVNGCTHTPIRGCCRADGDCDDHDVCTGTENCDVATGMCQAGGPLDCDDRDGCTVDGCEAVGGCSRKDGDCEDHDACTGIETCDVATGTCRVGAHLDCDDDDACTEDRCDAAQGCLHTENTAGCDDGNPCTADGCNAKRGCVHTPVPGCCRSDADCLDQDACNGDETCVNFACVAGTRLRCDDDDPCTDDRCDALR